LARSPPAGALAAFRCVAWCLCSVHSFIDFSLQRHLALARFAYGRLRAFSRSTCASGRSLRAHQHPLLLQGPVGILPT
jgi:hypothetical protein